MFVGSVAGFFLPTSVESPPRMRTAMGLFSDIKGHGFLECTSLDVFVSSTLKGFKLWLCSFSGLFCLLRWKQWCLVDFYILWDSEVLCCSLCSPASSASLNTLLRRTSTRSLLAPVPTSIVSDKAYSVGASEWVPHLQEVCFGWHFLSSAAAESFYHPSCILSPSTKGLCMISSAFGHLSTYFGMYE